MAARELPIYLHYKRNKAARDAALISDAMAAIEGNIAASPPRLSDESLGDTSFTLYHRVMFFKPLFLSLLLSTALLHAKLAPSVALGVSVLAALAPAFLTALVICVVCLVICCRHKTVSNPTDGARGYGTNFYLVSAIFAASGSFAICLALLSLRGIIAPALDGVAAVPAVIPYTVRDFVHSVAWLPRAVLSLNFTLADFKHAMYSPVALIRAIWGWDTEFYTLSIANAAAAAAASAAATTAANVTAATTAIAAAAATAAATDVAVAVTHTTAITAGAAATAANATTAAVTANAAAATTAAGFALDPSAPWLLRWALYSLPIGLFKGLWARVVPSSWWALWGRNLLTPHPAVAYIVLAGATHWILAYSLNLHTSKPKTNPVTAVKGVMWEILDLFALAFPRK